jgi:hypothetical protein
MEDNLLYDPSKAKKPVVAFVIATDPANQGYAQMMINSLRKFHTEEELPVVVVDDAYMNRSGDPEKFFKATPMVMMDLIKEYSKVIQINADCIITGSLDYILKKSDYDIGVVLNFSKLDLMEYGPIQVARIEPQEYINNGFNVVTSEKFVRHWWALCNHPHFKRYQYREQDMLNFMCHYGEYKVRCFDEYDPEENYSAWHGLMWKGEGPKMKLIDGKIILPKSPDDYPNRDVEIKMTHYAGGNVPKMQYRILFNDDIVRYMDWLVSDSKEPFKK